MNAQEKKTILVVDDEPNVRDFLKAVLMDAGFQVRTARDGVEALEMIRDDPPDLISLDLIMPRKAGHKLLFELKRDKDLSRIPVLVVTALHHAHGLHAREANVPQFGEHLVLVISEGSTDLLDREHRVADTREPDNVA